MAQNFQKRGPIEQKSDQVTQNSRNEEEKDQKKVL